MILVSNAYSSTNKGLRLTVVDLEEHSFDVEHQVPVVVKVSDMVIVRTKLRWWFGVIPGGWYTKAWAARHGVVVTRILPCVATKPQ